MTTQLYLPALGKAITDRLQGDTTLLGLLAGADATAQKLRITNTFPLMAADPPGTTYPHVTHYCAGAEVDDPLDGRRHVVGIEVRWKVQEQKEGATPANQLRVFHKILERLIGDFPAQLLSAGPSYGLDRWKPSFAGYTGEYASAYSPEEMVLKSWADITDMSSGGIREGMANFEVGIDQTRSG